MDANELMKDRYELIIHALKSSNVDHETKKALDMVPNSWSDCVQFYNSWKGLLPSDPDEAVNQMMTYCNVSRTEGNESTYTQLKQLLFLSISVLSKL